MTIATPYARNSYDGDDTTSTFSYSFPIQSYDELLVTLTHNDVDTTLSYPEDFTATGVGEPSGGEITLTAGALAEDDTLTIRSLIEIIQSTDIRNQGDYYPEVHEDTFDRLTRIDQQQQDEIDRSLKLAESDDPAVFDATLPPLTEFQAGRALIINDDGDGLEFGPTADEVMNAESYAERAEAAAATALETVLNSVKAYGALGDGVTDDTVAIQAAIDDVTASAGKFLYFPSGTYVLTDEVFIRGADRLKIWGPGTIYLSTTDACITLEEDNHQLTFEGLTFTGPGTDWTSPPFAIRNFSALAFDADGLIVKGCIFKDIPSGIIVNANGSGNHSGSLIEGCQFINMIGTASGHGDGVAVQGYEGGATGARVVNCYFENCSRHSVYFAAASSGVVSGNTFYKHRDDVTPVATYFAACNISRSQNVSVIGNTFDSCNDVALRASNGEVVDGTDVESINLIFEGNTFRNNRIDIVIGLDSPTDTGILDLQNVQVKNNAISRLSTSNEPAILYLSGRNIDIIGNFIHAPDMTQTVSLVQLYGYDDPNSSDYVRFIGNTVKATTSGGTVRCVNFAATPCTGTGHYEVRENTLLGTTDILYNATVTNPNFKVGPVPDFIAQNIVTTGTLSSGAITASANSSVTASSGAALSMSVVNSNTGGSAQALFITSSINATCGMTNTATGTGDAIHYLTANNKDCQYRARNSNTTVTWSWGNDASDSDSWVLSNSVTLGTNNMIRVTGTKFQLPGVTGTTASAANCYIDNGDSNSILRSTSSARYKKNITDLAIDSSLVYKLRPVEFDDKTFGTHHIGLIAEEVHDVLPSLVAYTTKKALDPTSDSLELVPDGVQYQLLSVLLLKELKSLREEVASLKGMK